MRPVVEVRTGLYRGAHDKEPRGIRTWGFALGATTEVLWVPDAEYADAVRKAKRKARRKGITYVMVLP